MKLNSDTLKKLIREAIQDMSAEFGPDDPTEHAPEREPLFDKLFELLSKHFKANFQEGDVIEAAIEKMYNDIKEELSDYRRQQ